jgi:exopolysaccharide biosynthesis protein
MMIVLDPSRIRLGTIPVSYGGRGYTVEEMVERFDAVAGINAGGFEDPEGLGNGSTPSTMTVYEGKVYFAAKGNQDGFVGFDSNHIMHVGKFTEAQIKERDIQYGVAFGPVLVVNGESADRSKLASGINPRTAIGQRSDGAVLLLVIDGRQPISLGCTWLDLVDIFLEFGAVNACNLDGGSSTLMWYEDQYINNCASVVGIRPVPTTFLVMKEGTDNG